MKRLRWLPLVLLLVYAGILIGIQFHTHATGQDQFTAHCKSCQVSQTVYDNVDTKELLISQPVLHDKESESPASNIPELYDIPSGRSPPLS